MSEEENPPVRPKLIVPDAAQKGPKSQLLVPDAVDPPAGTLVTLEVEEQPALQLVTPGAVVPVAIEPVAIEPVVADAGDGFVVINEDPVETAPEPAAEPAAGTGPVKITAMTPPPVAAEVAEEVVEAEPVAEAAPVEEPVYEEAAPVAEAVYEEPEVAAEYAEPVAEYAEPVAEPAYQAPPPPPAADPVYQAPAEYYQPEVAQPVAPMMAPVLAPQVAPAVYQPAPAQNPYGQQQGYPQQGGYAPPQPGYGGMPGAAQGLQISQPKGVPGWALFLLGLLAGFLVTLSLFKFTALAEGLRPDLIERGRDLVKTARASSDQGEPDPPKPTPAPAPDEGAEAPVGEEGEAAEGGEEDAPADE
jgi:hypothetical protein